MTSREELQQLQAEAKRALLRGPHESLNWRDLKRRRPERHDAAPDINPIDWFSHSLLVASQGSGKTNVIRWRSNQILPLVKRAQATLIVLDPKDVLTRELPTVARADGLKDRTILIDPLAAPVSFDLFDKGDGSPYAVHETIGRLTRLLNTITLGLTPFQRDLLAVCIDALFASSDTPSFAGLFPILRNGKMALPLHKLSEDVRDFFEHDFRESEARYVVTRLNSFRNNPFFKPLVSGTAPTFDLFSEMQAGKLILIKAGVSEPLYGCIWIEQIDRVIEARLALPEDQRTPTFVIIDEAQIFIAQDVHFADILDRAREARISMFIACQHMEQIRDPHVRASLYNSALKFIAKTNGDVHNLSRSMAGDIDANRFRTIPRHHFLFCSPDTDQAELVKFPLVTFPKPRREDVEFFLRQRQPKLFPPTPRHQETSAVPQPPTAPRAAPTLDPPLVEDSEGSPHWSNDVM